MPPHRQNKTPHLIFPACTQAQPPPVRLNTFQILKHIDTLILYLTNRNKSNMNNLRTFGQTIRNHREAKGLLLRQLASALDVDTAFISKMERDDKKATRAHVEKLAIALNVSKDELLTIWLADKLLNTLQQEPSAYKALRLTEQRLNNLMNHA
jgi:transcriptional regulator with XRE-family HTH domain